MRHFRNTTAALESSLSSRACSGGACPSPRCCLRLRLPWWRASLGGNLGSMPSLTLHLVRHGDTEASADGTMCGDRDVPLVATGLAQARALSLAVASLAPRALFVSPLRRARETAAPSATATGLIASVHEGLREIAYGAWDGLGESEIAQKDPELFASWSHDPALFAPPGGESAYAVAARAMAFVATLRASQTSGDVVVFSHKATIRIMTCALLGLHVGRYRDRIACPTASITSFAFGGRGPLLVRVGDTTHLAVAVRDERA